MLASRTNMAALVGDFVFLYWNVGQSSTRYRYPPWCLWSRSSIWFSRPLRSSLLSWHSGTVYCWHHKLGNRICQPIFVDILDEGTSWCWQVSHRSNMRREPQKNWAPWRCILLQCQEIWQSLKLVHFHRLPTCHYAPWLSHIYWWEDLKGQDSCWEENAISIQITDRRATSGDREAGKEGTVKSDPHWWVGWVCQWRCSSRNYQDNCILCQWRIHPIPLGYIQPCWTSHCFHIQARQHRFRHLFCRTPHLSRSRWWDRDVSSGGIQEHSWTTWFPAISVIMANWQRHQVPCWCSGWLICTPCCCVALCGLSTRLTIPR